MLLVGLAQVEITETVHPGGHTRPSVAGRRREVHVFSR